jgi:hypothetical protein
MRLLRTRGGLASAHVMLPEIGIQQGIRRSSAMPKVAASGPSP